MAELPGHVSRKRDLDLAGRGHQVWVRRALLALVGVIVAAALLNVFGQRTTTSTAGAPAGTLEVTAPDHLRGGLIFEGRFDIHAQTAIRHPRLLLDPGWTEGITLNTAEPAPTAERSRGRKLELGFSRLPAGSDFTFYTQWQVNPVTVAHRSQDVTLYDGQVPLASVDRQVTVFP